jgi:hypothetical protein
MIAFEPGELTMQPINRAQRDERLAGNDVRWIVLDREANPTQTQ